MDEANDSWGSIRLSRGLHPTRELTVYERSWKQIKLISTRETEWTLVARCCSRPWQRKHR